MKYSNKDLLKVLIIVSIVLCELVLRILSRESPTAPAVHPLLLDIIR